MFQGRWAVGGLSSVRGCLCGPGLPRNGYPRKRGSLQRGKKPAAALNLGAGQAVAGQVNSHQATPCPSSRLLLT